MACDWFFVSTDKGDDAMSEFWKLLTHKFESWKQLQNITIQTIHLDTFQCIATCTKRRREKRGKIILSSNKKVFFCNKYKFEDDIV